ncbi:hypothetical protein DPMN_048447 [Dreissena polymorpha]|uniref:C1q domain-containing protein n=1 Tax=Dreissena polymorpha TaxID=45954 RepID=A0A9D4DAQ1_DREPO|nr:hypothetical protein DPMN_048447 [Dreissena polymorpha]
MLISVLSDCYNIFILKFRAHAKAIGYERGGSCWISCRCQCARTNLTQGQPIIFETVSTNVGGAYHNNHGLFIAPVPGLNMFSASVLSDYDPHKHIETSLVVNGMTKARTHSYSAEHMRDQGSATMVVELNAGDEVWVKLEYPNDDSLFGNSWTSFTGALITRLWN